MIRASVFCAALVFAAGLIGCGGSKGAGGAADALDVPGVLDVRDAGADLGDALPEPGCDTWYSPSSCCAGTPDAGEGGCNECNCSCGSTGGGCQWMCTQMLCDIRHLGPFAYDQVTWSYRPHTVFAPYEPQAFVPDWCDAVTSEAGVLDCPGLAPSWPCATFVLPPLAQALTPKVPVLMTVTPGEYCYDTRERPAECSCEASLSYPPWGDTTPKACDSRDCRSLVALQEGQPVLIDAPATLAATFGPVETADEALAFATLVAPGTTAAAPMVHVFKDGDLAAAGFPMDGSTAGLVCLDRDLVGTELFSTGDGFRVRTFAVGQTCATAGLTVLTIKVTTEGEVTLESSEQECWYEQAPCIN
jgi:hypothetical protein